MSNIIEQRKANMQFTKSGAGNTNAKLNLSIKWVRDILKITEEDREVDVILTKDNEIIIRKSKKYFPKALTER